MRITLGLAFLLLSLFVQAQGLKKQDTLRGSSNTLNKPLHPLFIVDGIKRPGLFKPDAKNANLDMNPENIEKVEVVKGNTATLLYGEDGKNGVVLITTKKSKYKKSEVPH